MSPVRVFAALAVVFVAAHVSAQPKEDLGDLFIQMLSIQIASVSLGVEVCGEREPVEHRRAKAFVIHVM